MRDAKNQGAADRQIGCAQYRPAKHGGRGKDGRPV